MEVFGRYQLHEQLGHGGMGVVYRAFDTVLERTVALKLVALTYVDDPEMRERFFREARAAGHLTHKNIVTIYDLGEHDGRPYIAMEYLAGEDLQRRLARPEKMPLSRKLEVALEMCQGIEHAHLHGIIHRDLKPANIYLTEGGAVKILDFGLARPVTSQLTQTNKVMGTLNYMAPEQVRGEKADQRSDIFSFGVVLYELFGARKAFEGDSVASTLYKILEEVPEPLPNFDSELPIGLWEIIERTLAKRREDRYAQMSTVLGDLYELQQSTGAFGPLRPHTATVTLATGRPGSSPSGIQKPRSGPQSLPPASAADQEPVGEEPSRLPLLTIAGVVLVAAVASAWFVVHRRSAPEPVSETASASTSIPAAPQTATQPATTSTAQDANAGIAAANGRGGTDDQRTQRLAAETARGRMTEGRSAAQAAEAPSRARAAYRDATRRADDAERLFRAHDYSGAAARYYEASGLFRAAETAARAASVPSPTSAPETTSSTRPSPPAEPPVAPPPTVPESVAPPPVTTPATSSVPVAPTPPEPTPRPSPSAQPPRGPSDEERVTDLLGRYREALESRSLDRLRQIWPSLGGEPERRIRDEFEHSTSISVDVGTPHISISGNTGRVTFIRHYALTTVDGQRLRSSSEVTMDLRRAGGGWVIDAVRFVTR